MKSLEIPNMPPVQNPNQNTQKKVFGLNKNIFTLGLTSFFNDFSNEMILAAFPAFFTSVLKSGAASLGLVEGIADGMANFLKIYSGTLSDKIQKHKIFILLGYGLSVITRPFYVLTGSVGAVLGLRALDRVGKGLREPPRDVIISASVPRNELGRSFGYHRALDRAGGILGPLVAYLILLKWENGFNIIFLSAFCFGIISVATIFFVKDIIGTKNENGGPLLSLDTIRLLPRSFRYYISSIFLLSLGSLPVAVLLLSTSSIGLVVASIPLFYMVYSIAYSGFSYISGKLSDEKGSTRILIFGYLALIASYVGIAFADTYWILILAFIVLGIFSATTDAAQRVHTSKVVDLPLRGTAFGLLNASVGFGAMFSGIVGGYMWQMTNPTTTLLMASIIVCLGLFILQIAMRLKREERENTSFK
jgi:MFS family permease